MNFITSLITVVAASVAAWAVIHTTGETIKSSSSLAANSIAATSAEDQRQLLSDRRISAHTDYTASAAAVIVASEAFDVDLPPDKWGAGERSKTLATALEASYAPHGRVDMLSGPEVQRAANNLNDALGELSTTARQHYRDPACGNICTIDLTHVHDVAECMRDRYVVAATEEVQPATPDPGPHESCKDIP